VLSRLGDVALIPAICTEQEGRRPARWHTAVLDVLARLYRAWEAGDAETFVADYTDDASVIQPGVYEKDREEIRTNIAAAFAGPLNGSRWPPAR
jgi:uncharacterized protein (TIGR02246 family)